MKRVRKRTTVVFVKNDLINGLFIIVILLGFGLKSKAQSNSYQIYDPTGQEANRNRLHETYLALGYFGSFERNVFNDPQKERASGGFGISIAYRFPIANTLHMGFEFDLFSFGVKADGNSPLADLSIVTIQAGTSGKWTAGESKIRPFISYGVFYIFGNMLDINGFPLNSLSGYSIALGAGCMYPLNDGTFILAEFKSSAGRATWQNLPSDDAINRDFNPGGLSINFGIIAQFRNFQ